MGARDESTVTAKACTYLSSKTRTCGFPMEVFEKGDNHCQSVRAPVWDQMKELEAQHLRCSEKTKESYIEHEGHCRVTQSETKPSHSLQEWSADWHGPLRPVNLLPVPKILTGSGQRRA